MAQPIETFEEEANNPSTSEEEANDPSTSELAKVVMELKTNQIVCKSELTPISVN